MKRIKKTGGILLFCVLPLLLAGCARAERAERELYRKLVLSERFSKKTAETPLKGMAEDLCLITGEENSGTPELTAACGGLFSETDHRVLYAKEPLTGIFPASLTKLMTALLTVEMCPDLSEKVTVTEEAFADITDAASQAGLTAGNVCTVEDLLYGLLVPSGNDAANALAIHISGSTEAFVALMNERAESLGMFNTHFMNPSGLHDRKHYTTVYDLYLLVRACLSEPVICSIASSERTEIRLKAADGTEIIKNYTSGNSYLRGFTVPPDGLSILLSKTGYTRQAGRCLILAVRDRSGKEYIGILAGVDTYDGLYQEMNQLLMQIAEQKNE